MSVSYSVPTIRFVAINDSYIVGYSERQLEPGLARVVSPMLEETWENWEKLFGGNWGN